jgi:hypothetical protein
MTKSSPRQGGLGRGLGAIISSATPSPVRPEAGEIEHQRLLDTIIDAGLDAIVAAVPVDFCGYLHGSLGSGPQLRLHTARRQPTARTLFQVLESAKPLLDHPAPSTARLVVDDVETLAVITAGTRSHGVHIVARYNDPFERDETATARALCLGLGTAIHAIDLAWTGPLLHSVGNDSRKPRSVTHRTTA